MGWEAFEKRDWHLSIWPVGSDVIMLTEPYDPPVHFSFLLSYLMTAMWVVELNKKLQ